MLPKDRWADPKAEPAVTRSLEQPLYYPMPMVKGLGVKLDRDKLA